MESSPVSPTRPGAATAPTLEDVATAAGVSRATASRAINGLSSVKPAAAAAVAKAVEDLGYRPNTAARLLAGGRTGSVALILTEPDLSAMNAASSESFFALPLRGVMTGIARASKQLVMLLASDSDEDEDRLRRYLEAGHVDGAMVVLEAHSSYLPGQLRDVPLPVVYLGRPPQHPELFSYVDVDNYTGGRIAAQELVDAGRARIAHIAGPTDLGVAIDRTAGWRDVLREHGLADDAIARADFSVEGGEAAMGTLLTRFPDLDAVFVSSDLMAVGALRVIRASGRQVPEDVSVVGYDDLVVAGTLEPPLSSVRQPLEQMGSMMVEALLELLASPGSRPVSRVIAPELTRRCSVTPSDLPTT
ncbi:LacI family DNA-binding transcriptional regulator [Tersicoccus sp. MR15.9]|uniref:LacI family DNA-binding transcriptional regulator n=1 Tax=Tersicoccus mangrovi TaxID=3121635 RepID=UPI002FE647A3